MVHKAKSNRAAKKKLSSPKNRNVSGAAVGKKKGGGKKVGSRKGGSKKGASKKGSSKKGGSKKGGSKNGRTSPAKILSSSPRPGGGRARMRGATEGPGAKLVRLSSAASDKLFRSALPLVGKRTPRLAALVAVQEVDEQGRDTRAVAAWAIAGVAGSKVGRPAGAKASAILKRSGGMREVAELLAAAASVHRLGLLLKLLEGPATYKSLVKASALKPGPLYHHLTQLRLAGLIRPRQRDLYSLTRGGRNLVLLAVTLPELTNDSRPRPAWSD